MDELIAFLLARLDEDEAAAKEAASRPLGPAWDDGTRHTAVARHINRHDPARVLREVEADRALLDQYDRLLRQRTAHEKALAEWNADVEHEARTGKWEGAGDPGTRSRALLREGDYLGAMEPVLRLLIAAKAAVHSDHPDYPGRAVT